MLQKQSLLFIFFVILFPVVVFSQQPETAYRIDNSHADTVFYCNGPVVVAPEISIENININNAPDGIKISIINYQKGEDILFYSGSRFSSNWNNDYGNLELTGIGTAEEYETAVKQVFYMNQAEEPLQEPRSFSVSLADADYLPYTGHFYRYIRKLDISWTEARDSAARMEYYGLQGYLATITSSVENDFIWSKIDGVGWIGASDEEVEGVWKWVTGPEAGKQFWQGTHNNGYAVNGSFTYWSEGEPNNAHTETNNGVGEDYGHINQAPDKREKSWNDLRNNGDGPNSRYYRPQGFVVEFGGMDGDPDVQLSASAVVAWSQKPEMFMIDFNSLMCDENIQQLHIQFNEKVSGEVISLNPESYVDNEFSAHPTLNLPHKQYGNYRFEIQTTNKHQCSYSDTITVQYQHQPTAKFQIDEAECEGYNLKLFFEGETLGDARFDWYSNDTVYFSGMNVEFLEIPLGYGTFNRSVGLKINENGCTDSLRLPVTVTPVLDFWAENQEGCTPLNIRFDYVATEAIDSFLWNFGDGNVTNEEKPNHIFTNTGTENKKFDVSLQIVSVEGCGNFGFIKDLITVYPVPSIDFNFTEDFCYSENATVNYVGSASERDNYFWDLSDLNEEDIVENPRNSSGPLRFELLRRPSVNLGLQLISEFGCKTDTLLKTFSRKPLFYVSPDTIEGCPPLEALLQLTSSDTVDLVNYFWELGNGLHSEGISAFQVYTEPEQNTDISIIAVSSLSGCVDTLILPGKIFVYPVPEAAFSANPPDVLISNPVILFENYSQGATLFDWHFGENSYSTAEHPEHQFKNMGRYDVSLLAVNDFGCEDSAFTQVTVGFDKVFPPNAFSPNAVKEEDREFRIYSEGIVNDGYKLLIFNRWGEVIFESESQESGWDGTMKNGQNAPSGVYSWVIQYFDFLGNKHNQNGAVTLIF